ncbi:MAG: prepilin peptidase [candidate division WOR-3 bacterium]
MKILLGIFFFSLGAAFGSFFNVIIYRLPKGISLINPPSHCPNCGEKIRWRDNLPILSYVILNGKCRNCKFDIPITYLLVEILSAFFFLYSYFRLGISLELFTFLVFISLLIPISFIDLKTTLIPDSLSISGIVIGLILSIFRGIAFISFLGAILGAIIILIIITFGKLVYKQDVMGFGDLKLAALIGAFLGWAGLLLVVMVSALLGSIYGLIQIRRRKLSIKSQIPYGPFLAIGGVIIFFYGEWIIIRFFLP